MEASLIIWALESNDSTRAKIAELHMLFDTHGEEPEEVTEDAIDYPFFGELELLLPILGECNTVQEGESPITLAEYIHAWDAEASGVNIVWEHNGLAYSVMAY